MIFKAVFDTVHSALKNDVFNSFATDQEQLNVNVNIQSPLLIEEQPISGEKREQIDLLETKSSLLKEPSINDIYSSVTMNDIKKEENIYNELKAATVGKLHIVNLIRKIIMKNNMKLKRRLMKKFQWQNLQT